MFKNDREKKNGGKEETAVARAAEQVFSPRVDIIESKDEVKIFADMPGVSAENLNIQVDSDNLLIEGSVGSTEELLGRPLYKEYRTGNYSRSFSLSREIDTDRIAATIKDGVVEVVLKKTPHAVPRRIEIKT